MSSNGGLVGNNSLSAETIIVSEERLVAAVLHLHLGFFSWNLFHALRHFQSGSREYRYQTSITCPSFVAINMSGHSTHSFYTGLLSVRYSPSLLLLTLDNDNYRLANYCIFIK